MIMLLTLLIAIPGSAKRKKVKKYVGKMLCTTYHVSDNTPAGSRSTSSGRRAKEYHTIAVDRRNPKFKMHTKLHVQHFGKGVVEDTGGFGKYGVHLDLFTPEGKSFKKKCKVWVYRLETKKEYKIRLAKEREKKRQGCVFEIVYDESLKPWQIITDPDYIKKGACVSFGGGLYDVIDTKKGLKNKILMNNLYAKEFELRGKVELVAENVKG